MSFKLENFTYGRGIYNNYARTTSPAIHTYNTIDDDLSVVEESNYFNGVNENVLVRDFIAVNTANEPAFFTVTGLNPITVANILGVVGPGSISTDELANGAVTNPKLGAGSVSGEKVADNGISEPKLDTALQAKLNRIKASAIVTLTPGGEPPNSDTIAIVGKGIVDTDIVHVTVKFPGLVPLSLSWAEAQTDSIFVAMDGNIVGDESIQYTVYSPIA